MFKIRTILIAVGLVAVIAGSAVTAGAATTVARRVVSQTSVTGGVTDYQKRRTGLNINLGPQSNPTTVATKAVPPGNYLVTGLIGVNTQPGSFIVCALSNTTNGNDGIFGTFTNQWSAGAVENVHETEVVTVSTGQEIHLTCDDNNGKPNNGVGEAVIEAVPVNTLH
jgi:hypothetical protein